MKICLISEEFPPETGWGGIGTHTYNLSLALAELGHEVHVVSKSIDGKEHVKETENLRIYRIPESDSNAVSLKTLAAATPGMQKSGLFSGFAEFPLRTLRRGAAISRWLKAHAPFDIIEAPDYGGETFWCQFFDKIKTPVVIKLHTPLFLTQRLNSTPKDNLAVKLRKWMERYAIAHATKLISPTKSLADIISEEFRLKGIEVVPNCVDTDFFTRKKKYSDRKEKVILYAGRLERRKGVEVLAKAVPLVVKAVPDVHFVFVGRDTPTAESWTSMKAWLENCFRSEGVATRVTLAGEKPRMEVVSYYQGADICVLPSLWENLPYTCLESMSCGTPVVGSRVGGFPEIITDGVDGYLFEPKNHEELAEKIINALLRGDIMRLGRAARKRIESTYSHKVVAEQTVALYKSVTERSKR